MFTYKAYLNPKDFNRWVSALLSVESQVRFLHNYLPKISAVTYSQLIKKNILTQKYMSGYPELSSAYAPWKAKYGTKRSGLWELHGHLRNSVAPFKVKGRRKGDVSWMGGVRAGLKDAGGTSIAGKGDLGPAKSIAMYGTVLEFGFPKKGLFTGTQPPRPLFYDTMIEYRDKGFKIKGKSALRNLKKRWR